MNGQIEVWKFKAIIANETNTEGGINSKNNEGETPLHGAAHLGYLEMYCVIISSLVIKFEWFHIE